MRDVVFEEWPLTGVGDEKFFGYLVAVGVWGEADDLIRYADFDYGGSFTRYRLPNDMNLVEMLYRKLWTNFGANFGEGGIYGKFWIRRSAEGYQIDLP